MGLPLIQTGSFSGFANWGVDGGKFTDSTPQYNLKGSGDTTDVYVAGMPVWGVSLNGEVNIGGYIPSNTCAVTLGTIKVVPHTLVIAKRWELVDVTGCPGGTTDTEKVYGWGDPHYSGSIQGWVDAAGPLYQTTSGTFSAVLGAIGTIGGTAVYTQKQVAPAFKRGGPIPISLAFHLTGAVAQTVHAIFSLASSVRDPTGGVVSLVLGAGATGETISHYALAHALSFRIPFRDGEPVKMSGEFAFSKAP